MTARDPNIEHDVRAMVRRIVDGLFDADSAAVPGVTAQDRAEESADTEDPQVRIIAIGGDHGGFALKERLAFRLKEQGYTVTDCGTDSTDAVDYPD
ncbi:MAG: RpiB/LacA/LacB family sugar-phosphate isomerase, partial [Actinomycetia bacterium]|nr:RpiB/LacA/LacB family sugar-phosphate isomerase [Actinomycetes bacterium]